MSDRTQRETVESRLIQCFPTDVLTPLDETGIPAIDARKNGTFGRSFLSFTLYNNGHNASSRSRLCPRGLLYNDGEILFGVGVFFRPWDPATPIISIVAPHGDKLSERIDEFTARVTGELHNSCFYVRHLSLEQTRELVKLDLNLLTEVDRPSTSGRSWKTIDYRPWEPLAPQEDETYEHAVIDLVDFISHPIEGMFRNAPHCGRETRDRARKNYRSFERFLLHNDLEFSLETYEPEIEYEVADDVALTSDRDAINRWRGESLARNLIGQHFRRLRQLGKAIGSTATDYEGILTTSRALAGPELYLFLGFLAKRNQPATRRPLGFFAFEGIGLINGKRAVGNYAGVCNYDRTWIEPLLRGAPSGENLRGFDAVSNFANGQVFYHLKRLGIECVDVGGSETEDLDRGKRQLGAQRRAMNWLVLECNDRWRALLNDCSGEETRRQGLYS
ncbi:MAG: hypothetical protein U1A77_11230 [Pirellulales bacterium]